MLFPSTTTSDRLPSKTLLGSFRHDSILILTLLPDVFVICIAQALFQKDARDSTASFASYPQAIIQISEILKVAHPDDMVTSSQLDNRARMNMNHKNKPALRWPRWPDHPY